MSVSVLGLGGRTSKWFAFLCAICLVVAVAVFASLYAVESYKSKKALSILAYAPVDSRLEGKSSFASRKVRPRLVLFGDSRTLQWPEPPALSTELDVANLGVGGETSLQTRLRFLSGILQFNPDFALIQVGVNDLVAANLFPGEYGAISMQIRSNVERMVVAATKKGVVPIVVSVVMPGEVPLIRKVVWTERIRGQIAKLNADLRKIARRHGVPHLDANKFLSGDRLFIDPRFSIDTLHFNKDAYTVLNRELVKILRNTQNVVP